MWDSVTSKVFSTTSNLRQALCAVEPYFGGKGEFVRVLDYLDIVDKHRLLLAAGGSHMAVIVDVGAIMAASLPVDSPFKPEDIGPASISLRPADKWPIHPGQTLYSSPLMGKGRENTQFSFGIALGEPEVIRGEAVVPVLRRLTHKTAELIERLILLF